jgi:hypothetical protein
VAVAGNERQRAGADSPASAVPHHYPAAARDPLEFSACSIPNLSASLPRSPMHSGRAGRLSPSRAQCLLRASRYRPTGRLRNGWYRRSRMAVPSQRLPPSCAGRRP